jgi:hypothetical protein
MLFTLYANCHRLDKYLSHMYCGNVFLFTKGKGKDFIQSSWPLPWTSKEMSRNRGIIVDIWNNLLEKIFENLNNTTNYNTLLK